MEYELLKLNWFRDGGREATKEHLQATYTYTYWEEEETIE